MAIFNSYVSHYQRVNQSSGISYHPGGPWDLVPGGDVGLCRCPGSRDVAKHRGRSFDIINFTEIAWIFHNKVRYRDTYICIYIHMYNTYIYTYYQKRVSPFFMLSPGTLPKLRQPWSLLWRWLASVGLCQGPRWDMMGQNGGDCLSHYHPLKCHWVLVWKLWCPPILMVYRLSMFIIKVPIEVGRSHI